MKKMIINKRKPFIADFPSLRSESKKNIILPKPTKTTLKKFQFRFVEIKENVSFISFGGDASRHSALPQENTFHLFKLKVNNVCCVYSLKYDYAMFSVLSRHVGLCCLDFRHVELRAGSAKPSPKN